MATKPTRIIIPQAGIASGENPPRAVYDAMSSKVMGALGKVSTMRASNVEPGSGLSQTALQALFENRSEAVVMQGDTYQIKDAFASHWFADMTPVKANTVLGPFDPDDRDKALATEVQWLHDHNIPVCEPCRDAGAAD